MDSWSHQFCRAWNPPCPASAPFPSEHITSFSKLHSGLKEDLSVCGLTPSRTFGLLVPVQTGAIRKPGS